MISVRVAVFVVAAGLAAPAASQVAAPTPAGMAEGSLAAAQALYAAARYDEALVVLDRLRADGAVDRKDVEQYRSLCLLALNRVSDAEAAIAAVITGDPLYRPSESDASPRVRSAFAEVRRRLLPALTVERYRTAKAAYDEQEWAAAEAQFRTVLALIDDPENGGKLSDLRLLATGFLELSARAASPRDPPGTPPVPAEPAPGAEPIASASTSEHATPVSGRTYTAEDTMVVPPVALTQDFPGVPANVIAMARPLGLVEIVVDEKGRVVSMAIRGAIHPAYDTMLLAAARDWKYTPATLNGKPVRFRKLVQIAVQK